MANNLLEETGRYEFSVRTVYYEIHHYHEFEMTTQILQMHHFI